jgi:serine/threonine protein kinase
MTPNARILPSTTAPVPTDAIKVTNKVVYFPSKRKGKGATATVFEGYFEVPIKKAAIKICSKDLIFHEKNRELDIMRKLVHPNLVAYFTYEEIEKTAYIVMELADCTLEDWVKLNAHSDSIGKLLKKFSMDATLGLKKLHDSNVVHRDLKPSNVLVFLTEKVAKLADFGISKELDSCTEGVVTEACRGTRIWMPPEGLRAIGSPIQFVLKPSFDIFALGLVICYTMTKGKYLFSHKETESPVEIQANIINFKPNWNACMENKFTSLRNLLRAMTSLDPLKRPRTAVLLEHPFFWDDKKGLEFVLAVSNDLKNNEGKSAASDMNLIFQTYCQSRFPTFSWKARFCQELQEFMNHKDQLRLVQKGNTKVPALLKLKKYNENSLFKLVEFIRDYYQHYEDWGKFEGMKEEGGVFGADGSQYGPYFMETFPELTTILYVVFQQIESQGIHLRPFYKLNLLSYFDRQLAQFELMMNK